MTMHPYEDIEAYALGGLDPAVAGQVLDHAETCPTCAVLLAQAMQSIDALEPLDERPLTRALDFFSQVPRRRPKLALLFGGLAAAAILALGIWNINLRSQAFRVPIAALVHSHFEHHALRGNAGAAKVIQALDGSWLYLVGDGLSPRSTYYLWETAGGKARQVGSFTTDAKGQATAYWSQPPLKIQGFVVSNTAGEPKRGGALYWP